MPRPMKAKPLTDLSAAREGSTYQLHIEDEAGKKALFELSSRQALRLADALDNLLADEEELGLKPPAAQPTTTDPGGLGVVKWYNSAKGFGFVTPDAGGGELFLHRSVLEQIGLSEIGKGTRVRVQVAQGTRGPQVTSLQLA
jgi:cold shock protein